MKHILLFEELNIKDINSLVVGKKYKITFPCYDDYDEGLEPEISTVEVISKNKIDGYLFKDLEHNINFTYQPNLLQDCEIEEIIEEKSRHIPKKYLTRKPKAMKKEIEEFRGKKQYKKDWEADYDRRSGKRIKTKKSAATLAYQKRFGN